MSRCFSGRRLREARTAAGVSYERLALDIGRTTWTIYLYERGKRQPPLNVALRLAEGLGCPLDDLLDDAHEAAR